MRAEIVSVGTELLLGSITDTNASYIAGRLAPLGIDCLYISQVGDNLARLTDTLARAWERSDLTITTGGLGPTQDDLTREAVAGVLGETLSLNSELEAHVRDFFRRRGTPMPERNLKQAMLIPSASPIANPVGTAPGWWVERSTPSGRKIIVCMPGVPFEMQRMWQCEVEPRLRKLSTHVIVSRTLKVLGMGESAVAELVEDLMDGANPTLAPYAKADGIHLRITAKARDEHEAHSMIAVVEREVRRRLGDAIYGADEDTPGSVARGLLEAADKSIALLEVGDGAIGSVSSMLVSGQLVTIVAAPDMQGAVRLLCADGGANSPDLGEAAVALRRLSRADMVLAVKVGFEDAGQQGAVLSSAEIILVGASGQVMAHTHHTWRTARSEVRRLTGLAALNLLRKQLMAAVHT